MALTQTVASASTANIFAAPRTHMGAAPPPRPTPQERIKAYRDFLTPALHRRFVKAAGLVLFFCLAESWLLSNSRHFIWSWFPIGPAGARALLLFIPCLAVFIVRLANIHIGERTAASSAGMVWKQIAGAKGIAGTLHTMGWYMISAFFFGEVYIWSSSDKDELNMVDPGRTYERPRLNENPIAMRCTFLTLAVIQSALHLVRDYDQVDIAPKERDETQKPRWMIILFGPSPNILDRLPTSIRVLAEQSGTISHKSFNVAIGTVFIASPSVYYFGLRKPVWSATYFFAKIFFHNLPAYAPPTGVMHIQRLFLQMFVACFMLVFLWEASNTVFGIFVAQPPVKKGEPLTSEIKDGRGVVLARSKDPNGSLLTGLKSKKEVPRNFAFWELYIICTKFNRRRKTIYTEVERKDGSTWSQVCKFCLDEVKSITQRIKDVTEPLDYKQKQQEAEQLKKYQEYHMALAGEDTGLKRIADQGVIIDGDVYQRRKPDLANTIGGLARSVGSHPGAENPVLPHARKAIRDVASRLPEDQKRLFDPRYVEERATGYFAELLKSPLGQPFRQTFARRAVATIFGTPNSKKATIIHAVKSLTTLAVSSLKEDDYGQVQKDVANIIRTFTEVIKAIEKYIREMKPHKTDVEFMEGRDRNVAEVEELLTILKESLEAIVLVFGEYSDNLGISKKELREAREASARPVVDPAAGVVGGPEMVQAR